MVVSPDFFIIQSIRAPKGFYARFRAYSGPAKENDVAAFLYPLRQRSDLVVQVFVHT